MNAHKIFYLRQGDTSKDTIVSLTTQSQHSLSGKGSTHHWGKSGFKEKRSGVWSEGNVDNLVQQVLKGYKQGFICRNQANEALFMKEANLYF
jgi:hypothetical protein